MKPFVKWAGGKRQILARIKGYLDEEELQTGKHTYIEPFLGGGAVLFDVQPKKAIINDLNKDLINAYKVIQSDRYEKLIDTLKDFAEKYKEDSDEFYYETRRWDRESDFESRSDVERAARMIFLNRTCYNGLYRVNGKGEFNTPIGRYKNPTICDEANIREIHAFLSSAENDIQIMSVSYEEAIAKAKDGDIIYIDPPYDYEDDDGFTKYQMAGFTFDDFKALKNECDKAIARRAEVIISNNATERVQKLFADDSKYKVICYVPDLFATLRSINCKGEERKTGKEIIIYGANNELPQANDIEKLIDLLCAGEEAINNKETAKGILDVASDRQVAYYLAALKYLGYLTSDKKLNEKGKSLCGKKEDIEENIYLILKDKKPFSVMYERYDETNGLEGHSISDYLQSEHTDLSQATIDRRASTIKKWVAWMHDYDLRRN